MRHQAIACAFFFLSFHASAQTYLNVDFSRGIPSDFTLIDRDGNTPSSSMQKLGFEVGTPWVVVSDGTNPVACSTSWYSPKGQSDDWMITPPMTISGQQPELTWRSRSHAQKTPNGYAVYIAVGDGDFDTDTPLYQTTAEPTDWTLHRVSLAAWSGQTVRVAFVDNSNNMDRLYVDDIVCAEHADLHVVSQLSPFTPSVGNVDVEVAVSNVSDAEIDGFIVGMSYGGQTFEQTFSQSIAPGEMQVLTLDAPIAINNLQQVDYRLWADAAESHFADDYTLKAYQRKVVAEEATGTWCGWCVRGLVTLAQMKAEHGDWFIGAAVHSGDPMSDNGGYEDRLKSLVSFSGYPSGVINRMAACDPGDFGRWAKAAFDSEPVVCAITASATLDPTTHEVSTHTAVRFAEQQSDANYALAYTIIENDVHKTDFADAQEERNWAQSNAYSGGASGQMGGFENLPDKVYDMTYQEVVRGFAGYHSDNDYTRPSDIYGIEGSLPAEIGADEEVVFDYAFTLPESVMVDANCEIIVMLVDRSMVERKNDAGTKYQFPEGHIINAETVKPVVTTSNVVDAASLRQDGSRPATVYTLGGIRQSEVQRGLNIVRRADGSVRKVVVR